MKKRLLIGGVILGAVFLTNLFSGKDSTSSKIDSTSSPTKEEATVQKEYIPNVKVKALNIKEVDGKYRYFFDIRNQDSIAFSGSVKITLYNKEGKQITYDVFNTNSPIEPKLGTAVYIDAHTGPEEVHGANGVSDFKYIVSLN